LSILYGQVSSFHLVKIRIIYCRWPFLAKD
jgi:hypothetical protein